MICKLCGWDSEIKQFLDSEDGERVCREVLHNNIKSMTHDGYCLENMKCREAIAGEDLFNPGFLENK